MTDRSEPSPESKPLTISQAAQRHPSKAKIDSVRLTDRGSKLKSESGENSSVLYDVASRRDGSQSDIEIRLLKTTAGELSIGLFERLLSGTEALEFIEGCHDVFVARYKSAVKHFAKGEHLADAQFLGGVVAYHLGELQQAATFLRNALTMKQDLGKLFHKHHLFSMITLHLNPAVSALVGPDEQGVRLVLVHCFLQAKQFQDAVDACLSYLTNNPDDIVMQTTLAEILTDEIGLTDQSAKAILDRTVTAEPDTMVHAELMMYRALALKHIGDTKDGTALLKRLVELEEPLALPDRLVKRLDAEMAK